MQLGLDFDTPRLVRVTPARLAVWADCRRRYRMTYLDRPAPPRGGAQAAATLGAVVHLALRALLGLPAEARTPDRAAALVDAHWSSEGFRDAEQAAEYRDRARGWVADYAAELPADVEIAGLETWVSVSTGRIVAEGRVDRIDRRGGEHVIVDYKTGRRPTPEDARDSAALALYALATERTLRRPCRQVELHHLPTGTVAAWEHDADTIAAHLAAAEETAAALADATAELAAGGDPERLFPPRTGPRCGACDMRRNCPEGRAAAPEQPAWAGLPA
ncbi:RecB family exonuclease [Pseudonocardia thermophila]|uniref:RecB family exonuclease n=1 Tax=Pseudonocardia thermophila TaxID=1848 RepID=A0A1M6WC78_PSETH|nr:PD-(D/E)XK nuclease family protein [Pseudonocardia thermophila]SHK91380.1 RecB family exonuclease [Pseudonocardia thermophila]